MNSAVFGKTTENVRKHRNIKLVTTERRINYLVYQRNYHTIKDVHRKAIEMRKTQILMNMLIYSRLSVLDLSKTVIYEFRYDYVKPKYCENAKDCYMDTDICTDC